MTRLTPFQQALLSLGGFGWVVTDAADVDRKKLELRNLGLTEEQVERVLLAAKARAHRSTAPNSVAIQIVLDVAIYKAKRGDETEELLGELEAIS